MVECCSLVMGKGLDKGFVNWVEDIYSCYLVCWKDLILIFCEICFSIGSEWIFDKWYFYIIFSN